MRPRASSCRPTGPRQRAGRLKQWLNLMRRRFPEAEDAFNHVRTMRNQRDITAWLKTQHGPFEVTEPTQKEVDWQLTH